MSAATRRQGARLDSPDAVNYLYYYVQLTARNPADLFSRHPPLLQTAERTWTSVMNVYPLVKSDVFYISPRSLHAILCVADALPPEDQPAPEEGFFHDLVTEGEGVPDLVADKAVEFYRALCIHGWLRTAAEENILTEFGFWDSEAGIRLITSPSDLEELRSAILRKKL